jgi:rhamnosyltransferase
VSTPAVSIVLPTRNGMATLPSLLDAVSRQRCAFAYEVVAVDSGSTDGSADFLRSRVERFLSIPAEAFDHGLTRNVGIEQARGSLIVLLTQDAEPASDSWLAALTAPLFADDRMAGSFGRQLPRPDATALARHYLSRYSASSLEPRVMTLGPSAGGLGLDTLAPMTQLERCTFDNVCSSIRRSVWASHPFRATPIGEDIEWAREVLLAGYTLAYVPAAAVVHSHDRSIRYELGRTYALHRRLYELFRLRTVPTVPHLLRAIASSLVEHARCEREGGAVVPSARAIALACAWPLGQYLGALAAVRGWPQKRSGVL